MRNRLSHSWPFILLFFLVVIFLMFIRHEATREVALRNTRLVENGIVSPLEVYHDSKRGVTCWSLPLALSCLPDSALLKESK